jgi:hypothetical protein
LVHAETLKKDGTLYMENLRSAKVTDRYIMKAAQPANTTGMPGGSAMGGGFM